MASRNKPPGMAPANMAQMSSAAMLHRRPVAQKSLSLLHSKRRTSPLSNECTNEKSDSSGESQRHGASEGTDSPSSLRPGKTSSGESSNADRWFEKSNNEVRDQSASFADDEPPFFMRNSSSSETPPEIRARNQALQHGGEGSSSLPLRTDMLRINTDGSSIEDYRGVIDDLTIENKKLKRKLKKLQKQRDPRTKNERLIEISAPGLSVHQKRRLEQTLREFALGLDNNSGFYPEGYANLIPVLTKQATSATSNTNNDSAYHTNSASGRESSGMSGADRGYKPVGSTAASRTQSIHSFLHHIPEGSRPQVNYATMSERQKKKLAVRRLEEIFTGKSAVGGHLHSLQQQELSWNAEGSGVNSRAHAEGMREAPIMPRAKPEQAAKAPAAESPTASPTNQIRLGQDPDESTQRPTRPLDVDPHRASIAAENMKYIRHLGFSPPEPNSRAPVEDNHGWIYLNLLTSMAQLHDLSVTGEFIRKALAEHATKLELSSDGRKVRWIGDRSALQNGVWQTSRSGGESSNSRVDFGTPDVESPQRRPKLRGRHSGRSAGSAASRSQDAHKLQYTPLFSHRGNGENSDDDSSSDGENSIFSLQPAQATGDSSAMTSEGMQTVSTKRRKICDDGPLIFFKNNANFIADLSGEQDLESEDFGTRYLPLSMKALGLPQVKPGLTVEKRGPLASAVNLPEPMDLNDNPIPESMEISFPPASSPHSDDGMKRPVDMEVTGIGGVWPADNFAINVKSRTAPVADDASRSVRPSTASVVAPKIAQILGGSGQPSQPRAQIRQRQVISARRLDLPPSELPPALTLIGAEDGSDDEDSGVDDDEMVWEAPLSDGHAPYAAPQPLNIQYKSHEMDESEGDGSDASESSEASEDSTVFDMLATARAADPEAIREEERGYEADMAERLAEEIPAGSSAATAGGGSGYASGAEDMKPDEHRRLTKRTRNSARRPRLGRESGSMIVQVAMQSDEEGEKDENEEDDDDEDEDEDSSEEEEGEENDEDDDVRS